MHRTYLKRQKKLERITPKTSVIKKLIKLYTKLIDADKKLDLALAERKKLDKKHKKILKELDDGFIVDIGKLADKISASVSKLNRCVSKIEKFDLKIEKGESKEKTLRRKYKNETNNRTDSCNDNTSVPSSNR